VPGKVGPLALFDREKTGRGQRLLAGVDEAGRGCWAGPVVAAAVILPDRWCPAGLDDSKKLTAPQREVFYEQIQASALTWGACAVSSVEIDRTNILRATLRAMAGAVARLNPRPDLILVDGLQVPDVECPAEAVVRGDSTSASIAAASVVAKVLRDRVMTAWDVRFPGYGFASHKGYGAASHREALVRLGPCPLHRFSYRPVAELDQGHLF
jgi:ribonuclease HII